LVLLGLLAVLTLAAHAAPAGSDEELFLRNYAAMPFADSYMSPQLFALRSAKRGLGPRPLRFG
jgi:hypothetical protein